MEGSIKGEKEADIEVAKEGENQVNEIKNKGANGGAMDGQTKGAMGQKQ